jgi:hypothetical protein
VKIGSKVRTIGFNKGLIGIVTKVREGYDPQNHGTIEIRITENLKPKVFSWLNVGDLEHFSFYQWNKDLEILEEG